MIQARCHLLTGNGHWRNLHTYYLHVHRRVVVASGREELRGKRHFVGGSSTSSLHQGRGRGTTRRGHLGIYMYTESRVPGNIQGNRLSRYNQQEAVISIQKSRLCSASGDLGNKSSSLDYSIECIILCSSVISHFQCTRKEESSSGLL